MVIEVELKTQIPNKEWLLQKLGSECKLKTQENHLNHYYQIPTITTLTNLGHKLSLDSSEQFLQMLQNGKNFSVRTRCKYNDSKRDKKTYLFIKYGLEKGNGEHGTQRQEFSKQIDMNMEELDKTLADAGLEVQACWSRQRWLCSYKEFTVAIDFNAGYGWLAEFEIEVETSDEAKVAETKIRTLLSILNIEPINPAKLEKMFAYYNTHWREYYLTQKTFDSSEM